MELAGQGDFRNTYRILNSSSAVQWKCYLNCYTLADIIFFHCYRLSAVSANAEQGRLSLSVQRKLRRTEVESVGRMWLN